MASRQDDIFDSVVFLEETCQKEGFASGIHEGKKSGWMEGFDYGLENGKAIGAEIGFYEGFLSTLLTLNDKKTAAYTNDRVKLKIGALLTMLSDEDWSTGTEDFANKMTIVRAKFKQVCSSLKINTEYTKSASEKLAF